MHAISQFCRLGLVHFQMWPECMRGEGPIVATVEQIARDGDFEVLEIGPIVDQGAREEVVAIARESRLQLVYAAQPAILIARLNLNHPDPQQRTTAIDMLKLHLERARQMQAVSFAVMAGADPEPSERESACELLADSLRQLCDYAPEMPITLHTFDREVDKKVLIGPTADAVRVARRVDRINFGLLLDLSHLPMIGERPADAVAAAGLDLRAVHLGNCVLGERGSALFGDTHPRFGCPGGCNDVKQIAEFLEALFAADFLHPRHRPVVSFEVRPHGPEQPELIIANCKRALGAALALAAPISPSKL